MTSARRFTSGTPLGALRDTRWLNYVSEGAEFAHGRRLSTPYGTAAGRTTIMIRNDTAGDLTSRCSVLGISQVMIGPDTNEPEFLSRFTFGGVTPDELSHRGKIAIVTEPLPRHAIGRAVIAGPAPIKVYLPENGTALTCRIDDGRTNRLIASDAGDVRVLWREAGSGATWAIVLLGETFPQSRIVSPDTDVGHEEVAVCSVKEGPIGLETVTGIKVIAYNAGTGITAGTRCEAVHYTSRHNATPHPLTSAQLSSMCSVDGSATESSILDARCVAEWELFSLEC